jgi:hypothetical protein
MRLAVPVKWKEIEITECEIQRPNSGALALTTKAKNEQTIVHAMIEYVTGGVEKYIDSSGKEYKEKSDIRSITQSLSLQTTEHLTMRIMAQIYPGEYIQGLYECPFPGCDTKIKISEKNENSLSYDDLEVEYTENNNIDFLLMEPVFLFNSKTGESIIGGQSLNLKIPTLKDYISGVQKYPGNTRLQCYDVIINCIETIDRNPVDKKIIKSWGMSWMKKVDGEDAEKIVNLFEQGGIKKIINLTCPKCMEEFEGNIDISSFFASGLSRK